jgi:hypothetical protein
MEQGTILYLLKFYNKQVFFKWFYIKECEKSPQSNSNIATYSGLSLADLGTLDTGPCRPVLSVSFFLIFRKYINTMEDFAKIECIMVYIKPLYITTLAILLLN